MLPDMGTGWQGPSYASQHVVILFFSLYLLGCIIYVLPLKMTFNYHIVEGEWFFTFQSMAA
jgi:hypothetical protein